MFCGPKDRSFAPVIVVLGDAGRKRAVLVRARGAINRLLAAQSGALYRKIAPVRAWEAPNRTVSRFSYLGHDT